MAKTDEQISDLVSQITTEAERLLARIEELEAERGSIPELAVIKDALRMRGHLSGAMAIEEIRLLLAASDGGVQ